MDAVKYEYAAAYEFLMATSNHSYTNWPATDAAGSISAQLEPPPPPPPYLYHRHEEEYEDASQSSGHSDFLLADQLFQHQQYLQYPLPPPPPLSQPAQLSSPRQNYLDAFLLPGYLDYLGSQPQTSLEPTDNMPRRAGSRKNVWQQQRQLESPRAYPTSTSSPPPPALSALMPAPTSSSASQQRHSMPMQCTGANLLSSSSAANGGLFSHMKFTDQQSAGLHTAASSGQHQSQRHHQQQRHSHLQQPPHASNPALMACLNNSGSGACNNGHGSTSGSSARRQRPESSGSHGLPPPQLSAFAPQQDDATDLAPLLVSPESLPFFEHIVTLLKPTTLRSRRPGGHHQYQHQALCDLDFSLTRTQAEEVALMRTRDPVTGRTEYGVQVLLRCFRAETGRQPDAFPPGVSLAVNGSVVGSLPAALPCRPGTDPVRPGRPVNISGLCRMSNAVLNRVRVSWTQRSSGSAYCLSVSLARVVTPAELSDRLLSTRIRPAAQTRRQIRQLLLGSGNGDADDSDEEPTVCMTTLTASLRCPLARSRIQLPVRSDDCRHIQCFDGRAYLAMNERRATWRCPCCDRAAPYASLYVDEHFLSVLAEATDSVDVVRFLDDGSWRPATLADAESAPSETIDADIDVDEPVKKRPCLVDSSATASDSATALAPAGSVIVVDLTGDSDYEDDCNSFEADTARVAATPVSASPSPPAQPLSRGGASSSSNSSSSAVAAAGLLLSLSHDPPTYLGDYPALPIHSAAFASATASVSHHASPPPSRPVFPFGLPPTLAMCRGGGAGGSGGGNYRRDSDFFAD